MKERLQKILSSYGVTSRRAAEEMIRAGRVTVNGVAASLGQSADPDTDTIAVDRIPLQIKPGKIYIMLNKPRGYVTTLHDEQGRKNVTELTKDCGARVWPVGRLDINSEGLLILTNDGELTHRLSHPSGGKSKTYRVFVRGDVTHAQEQLGAPMVIDGYRIRPATVRFIKRTAEGAELELTITEGRNRQIRKMCAQAGLEVDRLVRVGEGGLTLGRLKAGEWRHLTDMELESLTIKNAGTDS